MLEVGRSKQGYMWKDRKEGGAKENQNQGYITSHMETYYFMGFEKIQYINNYLNGGTLQG